jgi:ABC-type Fe3+-hydroxamate transport system substrate-binding protein
MTLMHDDLGTPVELPRAPARVVSLVPSLTESVAVSAPSSTCVDSGKRASPCG